MEANKPDRISQDIDFKRLVKHRWQISLILFSVMILSYFGFLLLLAYGKNLLAIPVYGPLNLGLVLGLGVIVLAWLLTGIYIRWANKRYDTEVTLLKLKFRL